VRRKKKDEGATKKELRYSTVEDGNGTTNFARSVLCLYKIV